MSPTPTDDRYYVERILDERQTRSGTIEYLVRWLGWGPEYDSWEPERHIADRTLIHELRKPTATTNIIPATWAFVAYSPGVGGRGLFARVPLERGQAICEYGGPRLPRSLQSGDGSYVLQLPRTRIIIDGNCDNLPGEYDVPRCSAIFANHSSEPNAALEHWPHLGADEFELSGS